MGAGIVQTFAICSPLDAQTRGWLQVLCLAVLTQTLDGISPTGVQLNGGKAQPKQTPFFAGVVFSGVWLTSTFWWIYISLHKYGGMPEILAVLSVLVLALGLCVYYAIACVVYVRLSSKIKDWMSCVLFASLWTMAELARAQWFTGFPWGAIGYAHLDNALQLLGPYGGVYTIGFVAATLACALSKLYSRLSTVFRGGSFGGGRNVVAVVLILFLIAPNTWLIEWAQSQKDKSIEFTKEVSYTLLQGNIAQDIKFEAQGLRALEWYEKRIIAADTQWVITPETALPVLKVDLPEGYWKRIIDHFRERGSEQKALLLGMVGMEGGEYTNRVVGINKDGDIYIYIKHHLVPFGEFIPSWFKWFTDLMKIPLGSFKRGELAQQPWEWNGQTVAVNICYEDVFGEELAASFIGYAGAVPTLLVNASNIGWFGQFLAVEQHLNASRMRTVELQRPMLRATNTGATAAIDHNGRVVALLPKGTEGVLTGSIRGVKGDPTIYAQWSGRFSLYPLWGCCILIVLLVWGVKFGKFKSFKSSE